MMTNRNLLSSALLGLALVCTANATARESALYELDPLVVSGDLLQGEADRLPSSVTVLDSNSIALTGSPHFEDLLGRIPNLNWAGGTSRPRYFQVRGIGENSQFGNEIPASSVGFIIDGIDFTGIATVADLFDISQVEVLRGPQAAAFGANALAGMVLVETAPSTGAAQGRLDFSAGENGMRAFGIAQGGTMGTDALTYRISIHHHEENGFRHNSFLDRDDTNGRDEWSSRLKLDWQASPSLKVMANLMYFDFNNGYDAWALDNDSFETSTDEPGEDDQRTAAAGVKVSYSLEQGPVLEYSLSITDSELLYSYDWDWSNPQELMDLYGPEVYWGTDITERTRDVWSHDLRLASGPESIHEWVAGLYMKEFQEEQAYFGIDSDYGTTTAAIYGQTRIRISDMLAFTLAGRIERFEIDFTSINPWTDQVTQLNSREEPWGGKLALEFVPSASHLLYASIDRGYKAGGVNLDDEVPLAERVYDSESLWNFELGWRASFLERRLRTRLTLFYMDRNDIQVDSSIQLGDGNTFALYKDNAASGTNYGLEYEVDFQVNDHWQWTVALGLLESHFDEYHYVDPSDNTRIIDLADREQAYAPNFSYSVATEYSWDSGLFASLSIEGKDAYVFDVVEKQSLAAYNLVRLRIGYRRGDWQCLVWVNNLLDERYDVRGFFFANEPPWYDQPRKWVSQGAPRQAGISFRTTF